MVAPSFVVLGGLLWLLLLSSLMDHGSYVGHGSSVGLVDHRSSVGLLDFVGLGGHLRPVSNLDFMGLGADFAKVVL